MSRASLSQRDTRVHTSLERLLALKDVARQLEFPLLTRRSGGIPGCQSGRLRGRGLDFEQIRHYQHGDDVRRMDWRATVRTRSPQVRLYAEERDRPVLLAVDQRMSMFFGSQHNMKSVTAAEAAAATAWHAIDAGDRIGGIIFDDADVLELRPARGERSVVRLLASLVEYGSRLHAARPAIAGRMPLATPLAAIAQLPRHDHVVVVISDFDGIDSRATVLIRQIRARNDMMFMLVRDPMAQNLPSNDVLVASDGVSQLNLDFRDPDIRDALSNYARARLEHVLDWGQGLGVPVLELSTGEETVMQLRMSSPAAGDYRRLRRA